MQQPTDKSNGTTPAGSSTSGQHPNGQAGKRDGTAEQEVAERITDPVEEALALFEAGDRDFVREHLAREVLRLRNVIDEKDAVIWGLNRDIGAYENMTSAEETDRVAIWKRIAPMLGSLARKLRVLSRSSPAKAADDKTDEADFIGLQHRAPLVPFGPENEGKKIIAVTIFGLDREATQKVLKTVNRYCETRDAVPVVLTDSVWTEDIRDAGFAFEYVPSADVQAKLAPDLDWPLYLRRRMRLLKRKWEPDGFISFGAESPLEP